jgi:predicted nucleotidyltransferase
MISDMPKSATVDGFPIFRTARQAALLRVLFLHPDRQFNQSELARMLGDLPQTTGKELRRLVASGLVEEFPNGSAKFYQAATESPFYVPLRQLIDLALGPEAELRTRLSDIAGVDVAAIFGSWARGSGLRPTSDIDVLVVGDASYDDVADAAAEVEEIIGRDVQVVPLTWTELDERIAADSGFVTNVLNSPMKPLVGRVEDLKLRSVVHG